MNNILEKILSAFRKDTTVENKKTPLCGYPKDKDYVYQVNIVRESNAIKYACNYCYSFDKNVK